MHIAPSSLLAGAPQRNSTQSFGLYAISRSTARAATSLSASVHWEPSLRGYENLRDASSEARTLCNSAFTAAGLLPLGIAYRSVSRKVLQLRDGRRDDRLVEQLAKFDAAEQFGQQGVVQRQGGGPPFGQWAVAFVHEGTDIAE